MALGLAALASGCQRLPALPVAIRVGPAVDYRVREGDTLGRIAAWHGTSVERVQRMNGLDDDAVLRPGQVLRLPVPALETYTLRSGDTLGQVARWYGVEVDALIRLNDVADVRRLQVGQEIRIPATATRDGRRVAARAQRAPARRARPAAPAVASAAPATAAASSTAPASGAASRADAESALAEAQAAFDAAEFEAALAAAQQAERKLAATSAGDRQRLAQAHLLAGMSRVALGRNDEARESFRTAVALDESIALDPTRTSPKILTVFDEARAR